jgi:DNA polymerase I
LTRSSELANFTGFNLLDENRYFGRLNTGKMKIRGVMARKGDTPEYVNRMQQEVFEVLAEAKSLEDLGRIEPRAWLIYRRYQDELDDANVKDLASTAE